MEISCQMTWHWHNQTSIPSNMYHVEVLLYLYEVISYYIKNLLNNLYICMQYNGQLCSHILVFNHFCLQSLICIQFDLFDTKMLSTLVSQTVLSQKTTKTQVPITCLSAHTMSISRIDLSDITIVLRQQQSLCPLQFAYVGYDKEGRSSQCKNVAEMMIFGCIGYEVMLR